MKKILFFLSLLMFSLASLSARSYFNSYSAAYNVNLADPNGEYVGTDSGNWDTTGYNDRTLVAQVGFTDTTSPVTVTVNFNQNTKWMYQSASQPKLKRPFGLDVVVRQRWYYQLCNNSNNGQTDETVQIYHMGLQDGGNNSSSVSIQYNRSTDGSESTAGSNLPGNHSWFFGCAGIQHNLIGAWVEIVLVLPEINSNGTSYTVGSADDYYASFDITLSGGANGSWHCEFTGWYEDERDDDVNFILNVVPTVNASAINLGTIGNSELSIGKYFYSTTKKTSTSDEEYYAFVSSSESPTVSGGTFTLVRTGTSGSENDFINYKVGLQSTDTSKPVKWFTGETVISDGGTAPGDVFYSSRENDMYDIDNAGVYHRYDEGDILFALADGSDPSSLNAGIYTSYIYFHVITNK